MKIYHDSHEASVQVSGLLATDMNNCTSAETLPIMEDVSELAVATEGKHIFILQSEADGTVDRAVRRLIKSLGNVPEDALHFEFGLLLLGGAVCQNSANSMAGEIYRSGRKLSGLLQKAGAKLLAPVMELNYELDDIVTKVAEFAGNVKIACA
jgi:hypothetical protein